jgi:stage V sporulation protein B
MSGHKADKNDDFSAYNTARGSLYIISKNVVFSISSAIFFMLIARFLPNISDLGLIYALQVLITIGVIFAGLGLTNTASRFISYYIGAGREDRAREISILIFRIILLSSIMLSFILYILAGYISNLVFHSSDYVHLIRLASIDIVLLSLITCSYYILFSLQLFRRAAIISVFNSLLRFSAPFSLFMFGMGIDGIVIGFIIGDGISMVVFIYVLKSYIHGVGAPLYEIRSLFSYSLPLFGSMVLNFLSVNIDYYLVLVLSGLSTAGLYGPAAILGTGLVMILAGFGDSLLPYFSRTYGKSGIESLAYLSRSVSRYLFLLYLPLGFAATASASPIILGIFGERYSGAVYPSMIILLTITLTSIGTVFNYILMSAGHSRIFLISTLIAVCVQIVISIVMIPSIGATGAAVARSFAYVILFIYPAYRLKQLVGLHYDSSAFQKGLIGSVIMASIIFCLNFFSSNLYYLLPFNLIIGFLSYLIFLRFTQTMDIKDFEIINNILSGRLKRPIKLLTKIVIS